MNLERTAQLIQAVPVPVIASGGVTTLEDVKNVKKIGVAIAIIGRSLYEGTITYVVPEDGMVYLMNRKSGKSLLTDSINAEMEYKFDASKLDKAQYKNWGINVDKADFVLYFYPKNSKPPPLMPPVPGPEGNPAIPPVPPAPWQK